MQWFFRFGIFFVGAIGCFYAVHDVSAVVPDGNITVRLETFATGFAGDIDGVDQLSALDMSPIGNGRQLVMTLGGLVRLVHPDAASSRGRFFGYRKPRLDWSLGGHWPNQLGGPP